MSKNNNQINVNKPLSSEYDTSISLLNLYFAEWSHRDQMMYAQMFKFFYSILIIILAPNLINYFQVDLPDLPRSIFRLTGLLFSVMFLYFNLGNALRFKAISEIYQTIIDKLPEEYRRKEIESFKFGKLFTLSLFFTVCLILFLCLFLLSIILIIID